MKAIPLTVTAAERQAIVDTDTSQKPGEIERVINPQPEEFSPGLFFYNEDVFVGREAMESHLFHDVYGADNKFPYGGAYANGAANTLWLRETWAIVYEEGASVDTDYGLEYDSWFESWNGDFRQLKNDIPGNYWIAFRDNFDNSENIKWRPPVTMPRRFSQCEIVNDGVYPKRREDGVWVWVIQYRHKGGEA